VVRVKHNILLFKDALSSQRHTFEALTERLFVLAIVRDNIPIVRTLIKLGLDPNQSTYTLSNSYNIPSDNHPAITCLQFPCWRQHYKMARILVEAGANAKHAPQYVAKGTIKRTSCDIQLNFVRLLLDNGSLPNGQKDYESPLIVLTSMGLVAMDQELLRAGADVNERHNECIALTKAIRIAIPTGSLNTSYRKNLFIESLIVAGADVNCFGTELSKAARHGDKQTCRTTGFTRSTRHGRNPARNL
jgi:hypothetical protein